jgi:hypothetical protein
LELLIYRPRYIARAGSCTLARTNKVTNRGLKFFKNKKETERALIDVTSERGEVLLVQKMDIVPLAALVSSASKGTCNAIFTGNLTPSHVAALDELFLATNNRAGGRALFSDGGVGLRSQKRRRLAPYNNGGNGGAGGLKPLLPLLGTWSPP